MAGNSTNTILFATDQMPIHTDLGLVIAGLGGLHRRYHWLLSGTAEVERDGRPQWLTGDGLAAWVQRRRTEGGPVLVEDDNVSADEVERFRSLVYSSVLSAFDPGDAVDPGAGLVPFVEDNPGFWTPYPEPQHPRAVVEVVCFRGLATLVLSREPEFARRVRAAFPDALDLDGYIDEHVRPWVTSWAKAARRLRPGAVVTATVERAHQTTAMVALAPYVLAEVAVKQMRAARFGPNHWFALRDHLPVGRAVTVRVLAFDAVRRTVTVEFVRDGPADGDVAGPEPGRVPAHSVWLHPLLLHSLPPPSGDVAGAGRTNDRVASE